MTSTYVAFVAGVVVSLGASALLVVRLERVGARLGFSEALLGLTAALAANAPEISTATTALVRRQHDVGAGVILGSNAFNVAALIGLGVVVAGRIAVHRRVVALHGAVALAVAALAVAAVARDLAVGLALALSLLVLVPWVAVTAAPKVLHRLRVPGAVAGWVEGVIRAEEEELVPAIHPAPGGAVDGLVAAGAVALVVGASVVMEHAATSVGDRHHLSAVVVGGLVLAAVTSLPNLVAGVYLARRGRATAVLSETLNSNNLNVVLGLLIPAAFLGLGRASGPSVFTATSAALLTLVALAIGFRRRGFHRADGVAIITLYGVMVASLAAGAAS